MAFSNKSAFLVLGALYALSGVIFVASGVVRTLCALLPRATSEKTTALQQLTKHEVPAHPVIYAGAGSQGTLTAPAFAYYTYQEAGKTVYVPA